MEQIKLKLLAIMDSNMPQQCRQTGMVVSLISDDDLSLLFKIRYFVVLHTRNIYQLV